jgi:hypothetical protein
VQIHYDEGVAIRIGPEPCVLPFIAISFCPNPPRTIAQSSLGRPPLWSRGE